MSNSFLAETNEGRRERIDEFTHMAEQRLNGVLTHIRKLFAAQEHVALSDRELLNRFVQDRDEAAVTALIERHGAMTLGICRRVLGRSHDAEDACQAVFLVLIRSAASVRRKESLASWLHGVAHHVATNLKRELARRRSREGAAAKSPLQESADDLNWREMRPVIDEELARLPERLRAPLVLCYLEGMTRDEAALQLRWSLGTLRGRLERGRELLRVRLTRRGLAFSAALTACSVGTGAASAAMPPTLVISTIKAAMSTGIGNATAAGTISLQVAALTERVMKTMLFTKLKQTIVVMALLCMVAIGGGLLTRHIAAAQQTKSDPKATENRVENPDNAKKAAPKKDDQDLIQGVWKVKQAEANGKHQAKETNTDQIWVIADGKIVVQYEDNTEDQWNFKLDPAPVPSAIDLKATTGFRTGYAGAGIYELKSDTLRVCLSWSAPASRPTAFDVGDDRGGRFFVLQRVAKQGKAPERGDTGKPIRSLSGHKDRLTSVAYSPDGKWIATAAWDGTIRLWDPKSGKEVRRLDVPKTASYNPAYLSKILFSSDSEFVVVAQQSAPDEPGVIVWNRRTGERVRTFPAEAGSVAVSPDGSLIACGGYRLIRLYELATGKLVRELRDLDEKQLRIDTLTFSPDGKSLLSTGHPPTPQRGDGVRRLTIMPDVLRVWDVGTGKERPSVLNGLVVGHHFFGQRLALAPDGRTFAHATGSDIGLRETATSGERAKLTGHTSDICAVAFSPDGRTLATGSMDGTVHLWDLPSGKELGRFGTEVPKFAGRGWVLAVAFSPDGRTLVSGGLDKTANIWDVSRITGRLRTPAERSPAELEADWKDLAGDAAKGYAALGRLVLSPECGVPFLGKELQSAKPVDAKRIEQLIADLDVARFQVREQATKELETLAERAVPAVRKTLAGNPSLEAKRRLDTLLDRLENASLSPETIRHVRAVEVLESIGNPEARRLLDKLATGPAEMRLTQEAQTAVNRLTKPAPAAP